MISQECRWEKCTLMFVHADADPWNPSKGKLPWTRMGVKDTLYCNVLTTLISDPSLPNIFTIIPHFLRACRKLCSTNGQLSSEDNIMLPK